MCDAPLSAARARDQGRERVRVLRAEELSPQRQQLLEVRHGLGPQLLPATRKVPGASRSAMLYPRYYGEEQIPIARADELRHLATWKEINRSSP